jgi:hypothetical protein
MGVCGYYQPAVGLIPMLSHLICPTLYNKAFENDFVPKNTYRCSSTREVLNPTSSMKMGYLATFDR